jgi:hypothetical protein
MQIKAEDIGKIVELPAREAWGPGIICNTDIRFAYIIFDTEDSTPKKFFLSDNPLKMAKNQDQPGLHKRGRAKNRKIKPKVVKAAAV